MCDWRFYSARRCIAMRPMCLVHIKYVQTKFRCWFIRNFNIFAFSTMSARYVYLPAVYTGIQTVPADDCSSARAQIVKQAHTQTLLRNLHSLKFFFLIKSDIVYIYGLSGVQVGCCVSKGYNGMRAGKMGTMYTGCNQSA